MKHNPILYFHSLNKNQQYLIKAIKFKISGLDRKIKKE